MELKEAIERLIKEKENTIEAIGCSLSGTSERNDWGGLVQAIDTVLEALEIAQAKQEVAFEQGYRKGKDKGQQEGLQCGYGMGLQAKLKGEE